MGWVAGYGVSSRNYWLDLFTLKTWEEFLSAGGTVTGFRESRWATVQRIQPGDYFICYLTGISRFVGVLEVSGEAFRDDATRIWTEEAFPCRLPVNVVAKLSPEEGLPIRDLADRLTIFANLKMPQAWTGALRGSPSRWRPQDGAAVVAAVLDAAAHPVATPIDPRRLKPRPKRHVARSTPPDTAPSPPERTISLPEAATVELKPPAAQPDSLPVQPEEAAPVKEQRAHTEVQWRLLKLGSDMRLDVWVARNDRGAEYYGQRLGNVLRMRDELPRQFEDRTTRLIELIDVLWLRGSTIVAAFEIESTTSIYSGLLRMSDLLALQPNLNIPLYLVAPDERRHKVESELNRPTFNRLHPPLKKVCRYLAFSVVREHLPTDERLVRNLDPKFLDEFSESLAQE